MQKKDVALGNKIWSYDDQGHQCVHSMQGSYSEG